MMRFRRKSISGVRPRKRIVLLRMAVIVLLGGAIGAGIVAWRIRSANTQVWASDLHAWPAARSGDRILIFAPHCDDETLGLSGYTQQALAAGADVRVVLITNGDGFPYSAEREMGKMRLKPSDYIAFGVDRQQEALAAVGKSGLSADKVTFLGYPDGGLAEMWLHNWTPAKPFRSRFTGCTRSPYPDSLTLKAVYCGESVLADVKRVLTEFKPTQVFYPHTNENHPDHWATYTFVTEALWDLQNEASAKEPTWQPPIQGLYLVHRGDWPVPQGYHADEDMPPPSALLNMETEWRQIPLSTNEVQVKRAAIQQYASQMRVMKRFLLSFVRRNELVGTRAAGVLSIIKDGTLRVVDDWTALPESVLDPANDTLQTEVSGAGDLVHVSAAADSRRLYIRVQTRKKLSPQVAYDVYWHPLPDDGKGTRGASLRLNGPQPKGAWAVAHENVWQIAVPRPPGKAVMVGAKTRYHRFTLDKTGWRVLEPAVHH
jgi:LmbE family N-acetylglucosaminyl deacetylase